MLLDPLPFGEFEEEGAIKPARALVIDIFDARLVAQLGVAQARCEPLVAPEGGFAIEQKAQPFDVSEALRLAGGFDIEESLGHGVQAKRMELIEGGMSEQGGFS
jgi:hypothetical protein